jgi:type VI secretion system protein ImpA
VDAPEWATITLDEIRTPIDGELPCGESLRYEGTHDRINDARKADTTHLPRGVWERSLKVADWKLAEAICVEALREHSKDLQVTMWLMEAWINRYGMAGLRYGLEVSLALCETFWSEGLHPDIRDEDIDYRIAPLIWLNETLTTTVKGIALTAPRDQDIPICSGMEWEVVLRLEKMEALQPEAYESAADGKVTREIFMASAKDTPQPTLFHILDELEGAQATLNTLDAFLDKHCGYDGPSVGRLKDVLTESLHVMGELVLPAIGVVRPSAAGTPGEGDNGLSDDLADNDGTATGSDAEGQMDSDSRGLVRPGAIRSREQAYELLNDIAEFLSRIEPHSPTPYLVRRAVSWGDKSLIELLEEFVSDPNELHAVYSLLGLGPKG